MNVRQVYLYERNADCRKGIPQRDAGVGKCRRIDNDEIHLRVTGFVYSIDEFRLGIALQAVQFDASSGRLGSEPSADVLKPFSPVYVRLSGTEKIQVWAMQHQNL